MGADFKYEHLNTADGVVTRKLSVTPSATAVTAYFQSFQATGEFDASLITLTSLKIAPANTSAIYATYPSTTSEIASAGSFRLSAVALNGNAPGSALVEIEYSHAESLDPSFTFTSISIDDVALIDSSVITTKNIPNSSTDVVVVAQTDATVASILPANDNLNIVVLSTEKVAIAPTVLTVGGSVVTSALTVLMVNATTSVNSTLLTSEDLSSVVVAAAGSGIKFTMTYRSGLISSLTFDSTSGMLTGSSTTPAPEVVTPDTPDTPDNPDDPETPAEPSAPLTETVVPDGVNVGSGVTDNVGVEVLNSEVVNVFPLAETADVVYRQRFGDAVAFEAVARDGSMIGKFVGDTDSRTVKSINCGSLEMSIDTPLGVSLDFGGLSAPASGSSVSSYLNTLIDAAFPSGNAATADWSNSLKVAVSKATAAQGGATVDLKLVTPNRQVAGTDEITLGSLASTNATAVTNISQINDLMTLSGFENVIAIGSGKIQTSNVAGSKIYGDIMAQELTGGNGSDVLSGGGGNDRLTGGQGADIFELGYKGTTTIADLTSADSMKFDLFGVTSVAELLTRLKGQSTTDEGLLFNFGDFSVELVGYTSINELASNISFG